MRVENHSAADRTAVAIFAAGAAWPSIYGALTAAMASPLERAISKSWCGATPHLADAWLGHCSVCWLGAAVLFAASAVLMAFNRRRVPQAAT